MARQASGFVRGSGHDLLNLTYPAYDTFQLAYNAIGDMRSICMGIVMVRA